MFCHHQRVFPLCAGLFVFTYHLPSVWIVGIYKHLPCAHVYHWLDGKYHAWHQQHACAAMSVVVHIGLLVEFQSHAMSGQIAHDAIAIRLTVLLDGVTYVAHKAVGLGTPVEPDEKSTIAVESGPVRSERTIQRIGRNFARSRAPSLAGSETPFMRSSRKT